SFYDETPIRRRRIRRVAMLTLSGVVLGAIVVCGWLFFRRTHSPEGRPVHSSVSPDPRLTYAGPYRNIEPNVAYVGDAVCAKCHQDIAETYAKHPMARSLQPVTQVDHANRLGASRNSDFQAL